LKVFEERNTEVAALKKSLKSMNIEIDYSKKDSLAKSKFIKEKEKEVYKLEQKCQNLAESLKKSKADNSSLKSENSKLIKKKMAKVKKVHNVSLDQLSSTLPLITSKIRCSGTSSSSPTLSTDMLNNERPSSLTSFSTKLSSVTPDPDARIPQTKSSTANSIDSCSLETIASLDPTNSSSLDHSKNSSLDTTKNSSTDTTTNSSLDSPNNSSLGTTKNSSLDPTSKSSPDPTSSSLANTTSKNSSSSNKLTEYYTQVFNELKKFSMKVDAIGLEYKNFYEELKRK
jgi:hypothetical protein